MRQGEARDEGCLNMATITLGEGWLSWPGRERATNRYGKIGLLADLQAYDWQPLAIPEDYIGKACELHALVIEVNLNPYCVGDWRRNFAPSIPGVGEVFKLGEGTLYANPDLKLIGLMPIENDRLIDWLDPKVLYNLIDQKVKLMMEDI